MTIIFSNYFYDLVEPSNKEEILNIAENPPLHENQNFEWSKDCSVSLERLSYNVFGELIFPTLLEFQKKFNIDRPFAVEDVWKTTYEKGSFQEIHDHSGCEISCVIFLDDQEEDGSRFFFYNRHGSELSLSWLDFLPEDPLNHYVEYKRGDVLFFPSYMLHGVSCHRIDKKRRTIALNFI
jgi:hypothetical protein